MEIFFAYRELERLCSEERLMIKRLGAPTAKKLRRRMDDLAAARVVADLVAGRPHPLERDRAGEFSVDLEGGRRLVFRPTVDPAPRRDDGRIDWQQVTSVTITFVGDYHD